MSNMSHRETKNNKLHYEESEEWVRQKKVEVEKKEKAI